MKVEVENCPPDGLSDAMRSAAKQIAENPSDEIDSPTLAIFMGPLESEPQVASRPSAAAPRRIAAPGHLAACSRSGAVGLSAGVGGGTDHVSSEDGADEAKPRELTEGEKAERAVLYWDEMRQCRRRYLMLEDDSIEDKAGGHARAIDWGVPIAKGGGVSEGGLRKCSRCHRCVASEPSREGADEVGRSVAGTGVRRGVAGVPWAMLAVPGYWGLADGLVPLACSYVLPWSPGAHPERSGDVGTSGHVSRSEGDAVFVESVVCASCREACLLAKEEERIVAGHRKRDWLWVEDAQVDMVSRKAAMGAAGPSGWWKKLFTCKRQTRPEDEVDESRHSEETDEQPPKGLCDKQPPPLSAGVAADVPCVPADEDEDGQGPGDSQQVVGGGRADLRLLRKHIYDENGEQVWRSRDASK